MTESWKQWEGRTVDEDLRLGRYLGGSDHSAVYLADRGQQEGQSAAVKLIDADSAEAQTQLARWQQVAKLSHPNLLRFFQAGHCRLDNVRLLYIVMECAEEDLSQIVPQRPLTPAEATEVLQAVLDALAYIHRKGFVHGHITPANIMAVGDTIKLSSDVLRPVGQIGDSTSVMTPYAAPEGTTGTAADIWSSGMTLTEILTQQLPAWHRAMQQDPILPAMPVRLKDIAADCLRRDPARRSTATELAARLPSGRRRSPATTPLPKLPPKYVWVAAAVAAVLIVAAFVGLPKGNRRPDVPSDTIASPAPTNTRTPSSATQKTSAAARSTSAKNGKSRLESAQPSIASRAETTQEMQQSAFTPSHAGVVEQVLPDVPRSAANTIHGRFKVKVRVKVNSSGVVENASLELHGPSRYFANLSMQAARRWKFASATSGQTGPNEWIVQFEFRRTGTTASAQPRS